MMYVLTERGKPISKPHENILAVWIEAYEFGKVYMANGHHWLSPDCRIEEYDKEETVWS